MDIDDRVFFSGLKTNGKTFVDFVERILFHSQNIKKFRLFCRGKYNLRCVTAWMSAALRRNIESFEIKCFHVGIVLPRSLFSNNSFQTLKLRTPCTMKVPSQNYFPNLTSLHLYRVKILCELSNTEKLVFTFPVLETFGLKDCEWLNVKLVEIYAPALTSFWSKTQRDVAGYDNSIKIFGPKLVDFESKGGLPENFVLTGPPVVKASLLHDGTRDDDPHLIRKGRLRFRKLLKEFSSLKELKLAFWVTKAIALSKQECALPRYGALRKLYLQIGTTAEALLALLHSAPSLKVLMVQMIMFDDYDYDAMESVPSCIASHLEKVVFQNYDGEAPCSNLVKFLFKNGVKLKKCCVYVVYNIPKIQIMEHLSALPKASTCLSVVLK